MRMGYRRNHPPLIIVSNTSIGRLGSNGILNPTRAVNCFARRRRNDTSWTLYNSYRFPRRGVSRPRRLYIRSVGASYRRAIWRVPRGST